MEYRLRRERPESPPHVRVITNMPMILTEFSAGARRRLKLRSSAAAASACTCGANVEAVHADHVRLDSGIEIKSDATFWAGGRFGHAVDQRHRDLPWIRAASCSANEALQSVTDRDIFGVGDCATQEGHPHARAGVFAVRAAPVLAANLRAALRMAARSRRTSRTRATSQSFPPDARARWALGETSPSRVEWAWRWKDRIDRASSRATTGAAPHRR